MNIPELIYSETYAELYQKEWSNALMMHEVPISQGIAEGSFGSHLLWLMALIPTSNSNVFWSISHLKVTIYLFK